LIAASILAARTRLPWVIDYQDLWSQNYLNAGRLCGNVGTLLERALVRRAALLVTLSHGLARRIKTTIGRDATVAYFGYLEDRDNPPSGRYCWPDGRKRLVYAGRLYEKHQTIGPFLAAARHALSDAPKLAEQLSIEFFGPDQEPLRRLIKTQGLDHLVRCNGLIPQADALAAERSASALLFLDWADPAAEGVLTGKLFEYLRSGLPIAFVGSGFETEASQIACRTGAALILQNSQAAKKFLQEWPASIPTVQLNEEFIGVLSCRRQAQLVITEIEERLMPRGGRAWA
jgi:glycosyltransferase involved in cell wall biosynthesis